MDGGRILRGFLALRLPYVRATQISSSLGQLIAFAMGMLGLLNSNAILIFIALFIFIGASEEGARAHTQAFTEGVPVRDAMVTRFLSLSRADSLGRAADLLLTGTQHDFPVLEGREVVGVLTRQHLIEKLAEVGRDVYVSEVMEPAPPAVDPDQPLMEVLEQMASEGQTLVPVHGPEGIVGLVTTDNSAEYVLVRAALLRSTQQART
jgi:CBS domain-containing protein